MAGFRVGGSHAQTFPDQAAAELFGCTGGTNVQAIISNRFSFIFNLRGPNYVADTACSASLAATHMAKFALMDKDSERSVGRTG